MSIETENKQYEKIDLKRAFVSSDPEISTITPKSGKYAGKETSVLEMNVGKPIFEKNKETGEFSQKETNYYTIRMFGDEAKQVGGLLKKGMAVNVEGSKTTESWEKGGSTHSKTVINATDISLNLSQKRIKNIEFADREQTQNQSQSKNQSNEKGGKATPAAAEKKPSVPKPAKAKQSDIDR